jgi:hypothetical protein
VDADANGRWSGQAPVVVRFDAEYADGSSATRLLLIPLAPGWG